MLGLCAIVGHRRSKRLARPVAGTWRSECRLCGTHLERVNPGEWIPVAQLQRVQPHA